MVCNAYVHDCICRLDKMTFRFSIQEQEDEMYLFLSAKHGRYPLQSHQHLIIR